MKTVIGAVSLKIWNQTVCTMWDSIIQHSASGMNGGHGESIGIRNRTKLIGDLFKNSSTKSPQERRDLGKL